MTQSSFERVAPTLVARASQLSSATLHEAAGKIGAMSSAIKPIHPSMRICGPAYPVQSPGGDNLWLHRALYKAQPGDVLVVHVSGAYEHGYWGEVMATAAQTRGLAGLVIDGCVRDAGLMTAMNFPVFARGLCIRGTSKIEDAPGSIGKEVVFDDVRVAAGALVFGDADGVVCLPQAIAEGAVEASFQRDAFEDEVKRRLVRGERTLDIFGWS